MKQRPTSLWQPATDSKKHANDQANDASQISLNVNGQPVVAKSTDSVATALLRAGYIHFALNTKTGLPLAPACLMGVCFGCVCTIDGRPGSQACLEPVRDGLVITINDSHQ